MINRREFLTFLGVAPAAVALMPVPAAAAIEAPAIVPVPAAAPAGVPMAMFLRAYLRELAHLREVSAHTFGWRPFEASHHVMCQDPTDELLIVQEQVIVMMATILARRAHEYGITVYREQEIPIGAECGHTIYDPATGVRLRGLWQYDIEIDRMVLSFDLLAG